MVIMLREQRLYQTLSTALQPEFIRIENESSSHHVPAGSETHFKITLVSLQFIQHTRVARHRAVHALVATEFTQGLHALSLHLFTPDEWHRHGQKTAPSPTCLGGKQRESRHS